MSCLSAAPSNSDQNVSWKIQNTILKRTLGSISLLFSHYLAVQPKCCVAVRYLLILFTSVVETTLRCAITTASLPIMLSARLKTTNGEPPAKKLRISEQRSGAIRQLPSPDASLGSSSENTGLASSISPKRKLSQSFRDRILTRNDERSGTVPDVLPSQSKLRTKTSIAPIFKHNIAATWEAGTESGSNIPKPLKQSVREPSPEPDPEDLIKKLKSAPQQTFRQNDGRTD